MRAPRSSLRFLPALVLVLLAALPAHVGALWSGLSGLAAAEEAPAPAAEPAPAATAAADHGAAAPAEHGTQEPAPAETAAADHAAAGAEEFDPLSLSKAEIDLLRQLAKRRDELDKRERELVDREALLKATEQRIAEQVKQMQALKAEYEALKAQRDGAAEASIRRLVTVYEAMKPEEAARIFETMEGTVLLDVVTRMGERRLAPILAQMTPAKAQALTIAMAHRKATLPAQPEG
jgi:flagellar motility protein MotE (MotC chaperone)